jgi:hypothetical protein
LVLVRGDLLLQLVGGALLGLVREEQDRALTQRPVVFLAALVAEGSVAALVVRAQLHST